MQKKSICTEFLELFKHCEARDRTLHGNWDRKISLDITDSYLRRQCKFRATSYKLDIFSKLMVVRVFISDRFCDMSLRTQPKLENTSEVFNT